MSDHSSHLLSDLARCGMCGTCLRVEPAGSTHHPCYVCIRDECGLVWAEMGALEEFVTTEVLAMLSTPAGRQLLAPVSADVAAVITEGIADNKQRLSVLDSAYRAGELPRRAYLDQRRVVYEAGEELRRLAHDQDLSPINLPAQITAETLTKWWVDAPKVHQRELLTFLLQHIDVHPETDPDQPDSCTVYLSYHRPLS